MLGGRSTQPQTRWKFSEMLGGRINGPRNAIVALWILLWSDFGQAWCRLLSKHQHGTGQCHPEIRAASDEVAPDARKYELLPTTTPGLAPLLSTSTHTPGRTHRP
ncbi:hypothetical protein BGZ63DRAFT_394663 [Mariannaea sp. PMI_226]|nr:hypothetical protein BGZ63DRAFT_394663 [Mariannaea sp. PMI_226]